MAGAQYNSVSYIADGTGTSPAFRPHRGHDKVAVYVRPTSNCDVKIQMLRPRATPGESANWEDITDTVAVAGAVMQPFFIDGPVTQIRVSATNTNTTAGSFVANFIEGSA